MSFVVVVVVVIARHLSLGELKALEFRTASVHYNYSYDMKCISTKWLKWREREREREKRKRFRCRKCRSPLLNQCMRLTQIIIDQLFRCVCRFCFFSSLSSSISFCLFPARIATQRIKIKELDCIQNHSFTINFLRARAFKYEHNHQNPFDLQPSFSSHRDADQHSITYALVCFITANHMHLNCNVFINQ